MKRYWPKSLMLAAAGGLFATMAQAQNAEFFAINAAARAAMQSGDHAAYLANVRKLAALSPGHPAVRIFLARALVLNGDGAGAVAKLHQVADLGFSFAASEDAAFQNLKDDPRFVAVAQRLASNGKGLGRSRGILKLGLSGGSEGVAWSESSKSFLMGSNGKIHAYRLNGQAPARPVAEASNPQILGIRPDAASRSYLVCTNDPDRRISAVVRHHESSGAILKTYALPTDNPLCNDIALLRKGSFAVTDSNNGIVFHLINGKLEPLALTVPVLAPNGIASDLRADRLYVAHANGVVVHELATGESRELSAARTLIGAIDGMVWHNGALIAVQNPREGGTRLLRITPDAGAQTAAVDVLLAGTDFPGRASTVAVAGNEAFVIGAVNGNANDDTEEAVLIRAPLDARQAPDR